MKIEWEVGQVHVGIIVGAPGRRERWMIGYLGVHPQGAPHWTLNSMTDGLVQGPFAREELAERLTKANEIPADILDNPRFGFPSAA